VTPGTLPDVPAVSGLPAVPPPTWSRVPASEQLSGVWPTTGLALLIAAIFLGSQLLNSALPAQAGADGGTVEIAGLRIHLADGWQAVEGPIGPRLVRGSVAVDIQSAPFAADASSLYDLFVADVLAPAATGFAATGSSLVVVGPGLAGARGAYTGVFGGAGPVEGQLTALVNGGTGYVLDAWGPAGTLAAQLDDVELMIATFELVG
jgi:hypothetical protein